MPTTRLRFLLPALVLATGCVFTDDADGTLDVRNRSDYTIVELYVTDVGNRDWGPNLLYGDVLYPGESISVRVDCGTYDAMLVDETAARCEVLNLDLCFDDADWVIRNDTCNVFNLVPAAGAPE